MVRLIDAGKRWVEDEATGWSEWVDGVAAYGAAVIFGIAASGLPNAVLRV